MRDLILYFLSASVQLVFCFIIFYASKTDTNIQKQKLRNRFYLLAITSALWCIIQYAYELSNNVTYQGIVVRIAIVASIWIGVFFLIFARQLIGSVPAKLTVIVESVLVAIATFLGLFYRIVSVNSVNNNIEFTYNNVLYSFVTLVPFLFIIKGIIKLETHARQNRRTNKNVAKQDLYVSRGMIATAILAFMGNYVFSLAGIGSSIVANLFVAVSPLAYTLSVGYAVFSLKLFNFRKFLRQVIVYSAFFLLFYSIISTIFSTLFLQYNDNYNFAKIFILLLSGIIFYPIVKLLTTRIYNYVGKVQQINSTDSDKDLQNALRSVDTKDLATNVANIIKTRFELDFASLAILLDDEGGQYTFYPNNNIHAGVSNSALTNLLNTKNDGSHFEANELNKIKLNDYTLAFPLTRGSVKGILLVGEKLSGRPIYDDEISDISRMSNEIALALENSLQYYRIKQFNLELENKIEIATRLLRRNNDKLKVLDSTKDEFISMASHQLRTPLTSVKGYMSMVIDGDAGKLNPKQQELLEQAFTSSQRMVYLIADLLNVSRLHTGKFVIDRVSTQLADVVEGELAQLRETAKAKNIVLEFKKPKNFPSMMLDETKTRQVIMNFADNAIHYTPDGGKIQVTLLDRGDSVEYLVSDNGIGVPKADQHHMFTKFYRAGNARVTRPDGTGLGLFMAKKVIIAQGGAVIFSSQEGKGSTFGFTFPKTPKNSN